MSDNIRDLQRKLQAFEKAAGGWDQSIIGVTKSEYDRMDEEDQAEVAADSLHRAADLLEQIVSNMGIHLRASEKSELQAMANKIARVARRVS